MQVPYYRFLRLTDSSSHSGGQLSNTNWAMSPALSLGLNKYSRVLPLTSIRRKFIWNSEH